MTPLVVGIALVGVLLSAVLVVVARRDQRALWWRAQAHRYTHPEAVEPSAEEFAARRVGGVVVGTLGVLGSAVLGFSAVGNDLGRQAETEAVLDALVRAIEAEAVLVTCPAAGGPTCERPRYAVAALAGRLPPTVLLRVGDQQELGGEGRRWAVDLTTGPDQVAHCLHLDVAGPVTDLVRPARPREIGGRTVDVPAMYLGAEARLRGTVDDGPCAG